MTDVDAVVALAHVAGHRVGEAEVDPGTDDAGVAGIADGVVLGAKVVVVPGQGKAVTTRLQRRS